MTTPDIAVLLPVYNPSADLQDTLNSLRAQSVPFRLFLIDDGSKFHTDYETLTKGIDAQIIRLPKNLGITGAMNAGLAEILKGPFSYVARIDSGDIATPERFEKQLAFMAQNPSVAILGSAINFRLLDAQNALVGSRIVIFPLSPEECSRRLYNNVCACHPVMMIRRAVFQKLGGYSEDYPAAEDFDLLWRTHNAGFAITNLPDVLLIKDENPFSISQMRRRKQIISRLRIQWANLHPASGRSWFGMVRSLLMLATPVKVINTLKGIK